MKQSYLTKEQVAADLAACNVEIADIMRRIAFQPDNPFALEWKKDSASIVINFESVKDSELFNKAKSKVANLVLKLLKKRQRNLEKKLKLLLK